MQPTTKREQAYEKGLEALLEILRANPKGLPAREIAKRLGCSKPTVYARVTILADRGYRFQSTKVRAGERGPLAVAFVLRSEPHTRGVA